MSGVKTLSPERIAEIKAFKNTNFTDCPVMTEEELRKLRPRHQEGNLHLSSTGSVGVPEYFKPRKQAVQIRLDADVLAWFKGYGKGYQSKINAVLRNVMLQNTKAEI